MHRKKTHTIFLHVFHARSYLVPEQWLWLYFMQGDFSVKLQQIAMLFLSQISASNHELRAPNAEKEDLMGNLNLTSQFLSNNCKEVEPISRRK